MPNVLLNGDVLAARLWATSGDQAAVCTFNYAVVALGLADCSDQDVADDLDTLFAPLIRPMMAPASIYNGIQVQIIHRSIGGPLPSYVFSNTNAGMGSAGGLPLPRQVTGIVSWATGFIGRAYRGRNYWPFPSNVFDIGDGLPTAAYTAASLALATAINGYVLNVASGCIFQFVLVHKAKPSHVPPIMFSTTPIAQGFTVAKFATQRRRGSYGRTNSSPI